MIIERFYFGSPNEKYGLHFQYRKIKGFNLQNSKKKPYQIRVLPAVSLLLVLPPPLSSPIPFLILSNFQQSNNKRKEKNSTIAFHGWEEEKGHAIATVAEAAASRPLRLRSRLRCFFEETRSCTEESPIRKQGMRLSLSLIQFCSPFDYV